MTSTYITPGTYSPLLEKYPDSKFGAGSVHNKSGTTCHTTKQRSYQSLAVLCQKDLVASLNKLQRAKEAKADMMDLLMEVHNTGHEVVLPLPILTLKC